MEIDTSFDLFYRASALPLAPLPHTDPSLPSAGSPQSSKVPNHYAELFYRYVTQSVAQSLREVQAAHPLVPVPVRGQAWHLLSYALRLPQAWPGTRDLLLALAPKMEQEGLRDEWIPYLEQGVEQSQQLADGQTEAELSFQLGYLWRLRGDFGRATQWLTASQRVFARQADQTGQARAFSQLAYVAHLQGHHDQARRHLHRARQHLPEDDPELAMIYFVQGMIAIDESNWKAAEQYHRKCHAIWLKRQDKRKMAWSAQNIGFALRGQERYTEAIHFYQQAIQLLQEIQDPANQAIVQMNLGIVYSLQDFPEQALGMYALSEKVFQEIQDTWNLAKLYTNMSIEYRKLKRWDAAEKVCRRGIQLFIQNGDLRWRINLLDGLGLIYLEQKHYRKAEETFAHAISLLPGIKENPGYHSLQKVLTQHLCDVQIKSGGSTH